MKNAITIGLLFISGASLAAKPGSFSGPQEVIIANPDPLTVQLDPSAPVMVDISNLREQSAL